MNHTFNRTFNKNFGGKFNFSSKFYKNSFKNKSVFNAFNSSANKCQSFFVNFSNRMFIERANFLANFQCGTSNIIKASSGEGVLTGESRVSTVSLNLNKEIMNKIFGCSLYKVFSLFYMSQYGILLLI